MGKIIFARHGECVRNVSKRIGGQSNSHLTRRGIRQAHELAKKMTEYGVNHILSSHLSRAKRTADICALYLKTQVEVIPDLTERCYGKLEGTLYKKLQKKATKFVIIGDKTFVVDGPGVETVEQLYTRAVRVFQEIKRRSDETDGNILVISHAGLIRMFKAIHCSVPLEQYFEIGFMDNAEIFIIE